MWLFKNGKLIFPVKITFILSVIPTFFITAYSHKVRYRHLYNQCELTSRSAAMLFSLNLDKSLPIGDNIEGMIMATEGRIDGNTENFSNVITSLIPQTPAILCIQLAPKGKPYQVYPKMPEDRIIPDLYSSPYTKNVSKFSEINRKSYLTGPYFFKEDEPVLIIQDPVFLRTNKIQGEFWGFCAVYLKVNDIFDQDTLNFLNYSEPGYNFKLSKFNNVTDEEVVLVTNTDKTLEKPVVTKFNIKESSWILYTTPKDGWRPSGFMLIKILLPLLSCVILSVLVGFLVSIKKWNKSLVQMSFKDSLTELYNGRKFLAILKQYQKQSLPYTLVYLDLNDFKLINDNLGHDYGDKILTIVARKITNCIRERDLAFRLGGDEFAIILPEDHDEKFIENFIARLKASIERETVLENARMQVTTSAGYARCPHDSSNYEEVIKIADKKMYGDKHKAHSR
ncbi:GGDEF domain-containing protein [Treponema berlinense]|uniref:sensor domain-containing diguanylate cyclase n=1 Tax=Treponema berlinense TaxID=225004 RepID=UPI0026EBCE7D|nr:GGDEF domain-containing protein [Treponema berlinense]